MSESTSIATPKNVTREELIRLLNEDLSREYHAVIGYVVHSKALKGAEYMAIAADLAVHAKQELDHALILSEQIDYLGGLPTVHVLPVKTTTVATEMLKFDLEGETETILNYRDRVHQAEALGEYAVSEQIRSILVEEQNHQIDLTTALSKGVLVAH